jgi:molybdate transport system ATP-binding protein
MTGLQVTLAQATPIPLEAELSCEPGEILALVGPSGSGKSTVLRCIAGLLRPKQGRVSINGETWLDTAGGIALPTHQRSFGMVFQSYALFPHRTAVGNLVAAMGHLPPERRERRARELMELMHLSGLELRRPAELSGGQQQRVAVARALARDPQVLLLDEPFSAVDRITRQRLYLEIAQLRELLNMPIVLVTHDLDEATLLADRMTVLHHGRTLQTGTPRDVTQRPASPQVARLVDLRNVFPARIARHDPSSGITLIDWQGLLLETTLRESFEPGREISWAIPDGFIILHRRERPSRGEHENPVPGRIERMLPVGQTAHITLWPHHNAEWPLSFSLPLHVARRNGLAPGVEAKVSLLTEGIHIMPAPLVPQEARQE